jgi:hypothetical protein
VRLPEVGATQASLRAEYRALGARWGVLALPAAAPEAYLSGMEKDLQIRLIEELERAWVKCLPGREGAMRNELMRAAVNPDFRLAAGQIIVSTSPPAP